MSDRPVHPQGSVSFIRALSPARSPNLVWIFAAVAMLLAPARSDAGSASYPEPLRGIEDLKALARTAALRNRAIPRDADAPTGGAAETMKARSAAASPDGNDWQPGFALPGLDEYPGAAVEFRGELVVEGWLRRAGRQAVSGIARWTATGWQPLGDGIVAGYGIAVMNDRLYAANWFGGGVSMWDGTQWAALPKAPLDEIHVMIVHAGALVAAGQQGQFGRIASFSGGQWRVIGGWFDEAVDELGSYRGDLIAGGGFRSCAGAPCGYVARFNGTAWVSLGGGIDPMQYGGVKAIAEHRGRLIVGGWFPGIGGTEAPGLASWDGSAWSPLAGAPSAYVNDLYVMRGALYVAGGILGSLSSVARWDGSNWTSTGSFDVPLALTSFRGDLAAVGNFLSGLGAAVLGPDGWTGLEQWDDTMHGLGTNAGAADVRSAVLYNGDLVVAGGIMFAGDPPGLKRVCGVARWDGRHWSSVGDACAGMVQVVGNDMLAGGFSLRGNSPDGPLTGVARWDGEAWHPMGRGLDGEVHAFAEFQGRIYAGGAFTVVATGRTTTLASWDGAEWSEVPGAPSVARYNYPRVRALELKDDLLYVGGNFDGSQTVASPGVVAWTGQEWHAVGQAAYGEVETLKSYRGELYAGGWLSHREGMPAEGLLRWDGNEWSPLGLVNCQVMGLGMYDGRLVVGGNKGVDRFVPGSTGIVTWDGTSWSGFGSGLGRAAQSVVQVGDDLFAVGSFSRAGEESSFGIARWGRPEASAPPPPPPPPVAKQAQHGALDVRPAFVTSDRAEVSYSLPHTGRARLDVFDLRGSRVATLLDAVADEGAGSLQWSPGSPAPFPAPGVYFLRISMEGRMASAKLLVLR